MPRKKEVDGEKLIKAINSEAPSTEIMAQFGIKTSAQLKALYHDALVEQGKINGIVSARSKGGALAGQKSTDLTVSKRGSLVLPRRIVDEMGFMIGDSFKVRKTKSGLSLKKL